MKEQTKKQKGKLTIGMIAHVDAGKTTLAETLLYHGGTISSLGRVDHGDAFLDTNEIEKRRGITIFSKQARFQTGDRDITLLDTPGHTDFSTETERVLRVLDYAVLVISAADGVQGHTETLWNLLRTYRVPVFIFINKMDRDGTDREHMMEQLRKRLSHRCVELGAGENGTEFRSGGKSADLEVSGRGENDRSGADFGLDPDIQEEIAMCDEDLLDKYMETEELTVSDVVAAIAERRVFPCFFGSALRDTGVERLLDALDQYTVPYQRRISNDSKRGQYQKAAAGADGAPTDPHGTGADGALAGSCKTGAPDQPLSAIVFKITRDNKGVRLVHLKVTAGNLKVKDLIERYGEKVEEIRLYNGTKYDKVSEVLPGTVCAVTGLASAEAGDGIGLEPDGIKPVLEPVLDHVVTFQPEADDALMYLKLKDLEEEDPQLKLTWNEHYGQIHMQLMGSIQIQVLTENIRERFGVEPKFGPGQVVYKETISTVVEGVGHYEPLRHYAEVHLLLEPGEPGSGMIFRADAHPEELALHWQNLIVSHLGEIKHRGVLTGSEITDMKITVIGGRSHLKHTEPGDFREATYRAVRQGLMQAAASGNVVLLEPVYDFVLTVPSDMAGRGMSDIQRMNGTFDPLETQDGADAGKAKIKGRAPVTEMNGYAEEVMSYTHGHGDLSCTAGGYEPCHDPESVIEAFDYDAESDMENQTGSVFCSHGAGFYVQWDEVEDYMHVPKKLKINGTYAVPGSDTAGVFAGAGFWEASGDAGADSHSGGYAGGASASQAYTAGTSASDPSAAKGYTPGASNAGSIGASAKASSAKTYTEGKALDKELDRIFTRTFGEQTRRTSGGKAPETRDFDKVKIKEKPEKKKLLLVDGYNIIFAMPDLTLGNATLPYDPSDSASAAGNAGRSTGRNSRGSSGKNTGTGKYVSSGHMSQEGAGFSADTPDISASDLAIARERLLDLLASYSGSVRNQREVVLVFDGYKVKGNPGTTEEQNGITVVYTKENEKADQYIERTVAEMSGEYDITVATSDYMEQIVIFSHGARRMPAEEFRALLDDEARRTAELVRRKSDDAPVNDQLRKQLEKITDD